MPAPQSQYLESPTTRRGKIAVLVLWLVAALVYTALGVWIPWVFLLGFWQSALFVALITWLSPKVARRFA